MLNGLLCLDSKLERVLILAEDAGRGCIKGSMLGESPQGRKGGVGENPGWSVWELGEYIG